MRNEFGHDFLRPGSGRIKLIFTALLCLTLCTVCPAVSSKVIRHKDSKDLIKGKTDDVVIDSRGTIQLGRAAQELIGGEGVSPLSHDSDVWSINCIVVSGGTVYFGTSPNGGIYKYGLDKLTKIYPREGVELTAEDAEGAEKIIENEGSEDSASAESPAGSNEHIFAMATDVSGRLLAGISGDKCRLCRLEGNRMETIFEPNEAKYIFAITVDDGGDVVRSVERRASEGVGRFEEVEGSVAGVVRCDEDPAV